jgi:MarR family transcriptional regulator, organic hydroperoxide resistance regulator
LPRPTVSKPELLVDGTDTVFRSFIHDFLAFAVRVTEVRSGFGEVIGLTGTAYTTLMSIAYLQGREGIGVNRVAEHLHLSGAFVTIEVAKLVKAGVVQKRTNMKDRRRVLLTLTPAGRKLLDELAAVQAPVNDALFACLSADEFLKLKEIMKQLVSCGDRALSLLSFLTQPQPVRAGRKR